MAVTTKTTDCAKFWQRGISLVEAMVAVLIVAILFLGIAHVLSKGLVSQRFMNTHNLALLEMREKMQQPGQSVDAFCSSPGSLEWLGSSIDLDTGDCTTPPPITVTAGGLAVSVTPPIAIEVSTAGDDSDEWFGGVIRLSSD